MFYHRVLPPPPIVTSHFLATAQVTGRDTPPRHRIMTAEEPKNAADKDKSPTPSNKTSSSLSPLEANSPRSADQESLEDYEESTKVVSPAHSTRKRSSSQLSKKDILPEQNLPPILTAIPPSGGSLSQICLCQRDPKVPRPRNGMPFYYALYVLLSPFTRRLGHPFLCSELDALIN